jgi:hypothetical protein
MVIREILGARLQDPEMKRPGKFVWLPMPLGIVMNGKAGA